jgi:hypothetical protein
VEARVLFALYVFVFVEFRPNNLTKGKSKLIIYYCVQQFTVLSIIFYPLYREIVVFV